MLMAGCKCAGLRFRGELDLEAGLERRVLDVEESGACF